MYMRFPNQPADNAVEARLGNSVHWSDFAACKGRTSLFFAPRAERPQARLRREKQAGAICAKCPVVDDCRGFARENHEYGYWGSESEEDRHRAGYTVSAPIGIRARPAALAN